MPSLDRVVAAPAAVSHRDFRPAYRSYWRHRRAITCLHSGAFLPSTTTANTWMARLRACIPRPNLHSLLRHSPGAHSSDSRKRTARPHRGRRAARSFYPPQRSLALRLARMAHDFSRYSPLAPRQRQPGYRQKKFSSLLPFVAWLFGALHLPAAAMSRRGDIGEPMSPNYVGQLITRFRRPPGLVSTGRPAPPVASFPGQGIIRPPGASVM